MLTVCWAAKGGSGATTIAAATALAATTPTLLVDLAGDLPLALGLPEHDSTRPGVHDWLASAAPPERLDGLERRVTDHVTLLAAGHVGTAPPARWAQLAEHLRRDRRAVLVDAGTGAPPADLLRHADHAWLVTRGCYLAMRAAARQAARPTGIVLVDEPGRKLRADDLEHSLGAPVVATVLLDPAIARAVDSGLLLSVLPRALRRALAAATNAATATERAAA